MKYNAPQFELPGTDTDFCLVAERGTDGERIAREHAERIAAEQERERAEREHPTLL